MINKPVILTRDELGVYRIHISSEILDALPDHNYESLLIRVGDEGLKPSWGYISREYVDYRHNEVPAISIEKAKEIAKSVCTIVLALTSELKKEDDGLIGEIDF